MNKYPLLVICLFFSITSYAQQFRPANSASIYKELKTLKNIPKVLYFAAHPDDENTGLLSWLVNEKNVETAYISLTRGDGGQNLIGNEQGPALGLIRTYELLEARKLDGAKQFFTRAVDFGFSKNPEDTFKQWDIDAITADVVWVIRNFKPDIIISRFPPTAAAGHGQHSASAIIAEKAFKEAGDKAFYPEQLKYVGVWKPERLIWNTFRFSSINTTSEDQFKVTAAGYDPLLGLGYGELAGLSRSLHRSQGAGTPSVAGIKTEFFTPVDGSPMRESLFDGIKQSWTSINRKDIDERISKIIKEYNFTQPDLSIPDLLALRKQLNSLSNPDIKKDKLQAIDQILLSCAGFMAEVVSTKSEAVAGESLDFSLNFIARSNTPVVLKKVNWIADPETLNKALDNDSLFSLKRTIKIPETAALSEPYWLKEDRKIPSLFEVDKQEDIGLSITESPLLVTLQLSIGAENFEVQVPLSYKKLDPIKGDIVEGLRIVPGVNVRFTQSLLFAGKDQSALSASINLHANQDIKNGVLRIRNGSQILVSSQPFSMKKQADTTLQVLIPKEKLALVSGNELIAEFEVGQKTFSKDQQVLQYGHLPVLQYFNSASTKIINDAFEVKVSKVGYLPGAGDLIPYILRQAGIQVDVLTESDFANPENLAQYETIITGVRVLNAERRMNKWMPILNKYVENGGTLVMQYNTQQDLATTVYGPYPFTISKDRVTEEDALVKFSAPQHALLNYPNKITATDFDGWVQERGVNFPTQWDQRYETLFEMHDTGEAPLKGSTLYAKYGKGNYIYTSLAFFRQLPAGNLGATKLFFNMLSIGK